MKYQQIKTFPHLFVDQNTDMAWPTVVDDQHDNTGLLITVDSKSNSPVVSFCVSGDKAILTKAINQIVFNDEELALSLLAELSKDKGVMNEVLLNTRSN